MAEIRAKQDSPHAAPLYQGSGRLPALLLFVLALVLMPIRLAYPWSAGTPDSLKCKPLSFYRLRADARHLQQFNRLASADPLMVRLIYFIPNDRSFKPEVAQELDTLIKDVQRFYADQMAANGFGQKTFFFETDATGQAIVHPVSGQFPDSHYRGVHTSSNVGAEIETQFFLTEAIYLIAVDVGDGLINGVGGTGGPRGPNGGVAFVPASVPNFDFGTIAHELGHAFGLQHDFRSDSYIMSYGVDSNLLSACNAEFLSASRFFNPNSTFVSAAAPLVRIVSSLEYSSGASQVALRFELSDSDGLHQAQFLPTTIDSADNFERAAAIGAPEIQDCIALAGQTATVDFSYTLPTGANAYRLALGVIDGSGHANMKEFSIYSTDRVGQTIQVTQNGSADFTSISAAVAQALPRDRIEINDSASYDEAVQIVESHITLAAAFGAQPVISTVATFGATRFTLEGLKILDGVFVQEGAEVVIRNNNMESFPSGVLVTDLSKAEIEGNTISATKMGITVQNQSEATIRENQFTDNCDAPVSVFTSTATIVDNDIQRSAKPIFVQDNSDVTLTGNHIADSLAGGISIFGSTVTMTDNEISGSSDTAIAALNGSELTLIGNTITENQSTAIRINHSTAEIKKNTISHNDDGDNNNGFDRAIEISDATGIVLIQDNIMNRNGAGVFVFGDSEVVMVNNLISHSHNMNGHGILLQGSSGRLINNTIAFNDVGLLIFEQTEKPKVEVVNTLFAENQFDVANFDQATADSYIRHSRLSNPEFIGQNGNIGDDLLFVDAENDDFRLQSDSPVIDAGDDSISDLPEFDADGNARIAGTTVDIGAYEFASQPPTPTFYEFQVEFPAGISLRHLPLLITHVNGQPGEIQRLSDLYEVLGAASNIHQLIVYNNQTGRYHPFSQFELDHAATIDAIPANIPLSPHTGVISVMKRPVTLNLRGSIPTEVVPLTAGLNIVGLPLQPTNTSRLSDLAQLPGLVENVVQIFSFDGRQFNHFVPGGNVDPLIVGGHAYVIEVRESASLQVQGEVWQNN